MAATNPYQAPSANLSISRDHAAWPGLSRRWYWLGAFAASALPALLAMVLVGDATEDSSAANTGILAIAQLAALVGFLVIAVKRLQNIGNSGWWAVGLLVPLLNLYVGLRCLALPAGYTEHKTMDGTAKLLLGLVIGIFVLGVVAAIALPAYQDYVTRAAGA